MQRQSSINAAVIQANAEPIKERGRLIKSLDFNSHLREKGNMWNLLETSLTNDGSTLRKVIRK